jgi:hypothetical protein
MSSEYINSLEYLKDRINILASETQESYFIKKLDLLIISIKQKAETYSDSKILPDIYITLVREFKSILVKVTHQGNKELLLSICSDLEVEIKKLETKYVR